MALHDITSASAVQKAIGEFDRLGAETFLKTYGYKPAREYHLIYDGRRYPSKAIIGVAHRHEFPEEGPLSYKTFSGGSTAAAPKLQSLGFDVVRGDDVVRPGDVLSNSDLSKKFAVGNMGGMRRSRKLNHLVLVSDPTKVLYDDRWEGDLLLYTGEAKSGDQSYVRQNRTLAESTNTKIPVHLFEVFTATRYTYAGEVRLAGDPRTEQQIGEDGEIRQVIMFPLRLLSGGQKGIPSRDSLEKISTARRKKLGKLSLSDLKRRAALAPRKPQVRESQTTQLARNQAVVEYVKMAASGICDLCDKPAPFKNKEGVDYLECHHVVRLADQGDDIISNAVALCPNCHRRMHVLNKNADRRKLLARISIRGD